MVSLLTFQNDGLSFDVDDSGGDGDGVILLHGFPQTKESWHAVTPALTDAGYRVLAPDQRGYSPAARPPRPRDYSLAQPRSEARRVGEEWFSTCHSRWSPYH